MIEQRHIYTVTEINDQIKGLLEKTFPLIWITGEISNFRKPTSGHAYFTLKDVHSQISAVMFRTQMRNLKFDPEDGLGIVGLGRISVYEPRGSYQIILEYIEPKGIGALQIAFEQLKEKLSAEGLFDDNHKKLIPYLPSRISVITSPTGAVIHDILHIVNRRFPGISVEIVPVRVQGDNAAEEIVQALKSLNERPSSEVIILARGGGSIEDLQPFNSEQVARAIFASKVPLISAVGHETDFTISDFVADLRAPTPSAAAELAVPSRDELIRHCTELNRRLISWAYRYIGQLRTVYLDYKRRLIHPRQRIQDSRLRLDDISGRIIRTITNRIERHSEKLTWQTSALMTASPRIQIRNYRVLLDQYAVNQLNHLKILLANNQSEFRETTAKLQALSPLAILTRGYSITRSVTDGKVIRNAQDVSIGQELEILLSKGSLSCKVERIL
jgi:exodeoxyribonuclease VII large subunit